MAIFVVVAVLQARMRMRRRHAPLLHACTTTGHDRQRLLAARARPAHAANAARRKFTGAGTAVAAVAMQPAQRTSLMLPTRGWRGWWGRGVVREDAAVLWGAGGGLSQPSCPAQGALVLSLSLPLCSGRLTHTQREWAHKPSARVEE